MKNLFVGVGANRASLPSEEVDFFMENWQSLIFGTDTHNHMLWVERVKKINAEVRYSSDFPSDFARSTNLDYIHRNY